MQRGIISTRNQKFPALQKFHFILKAATDNCLYAVVFNFHSLLYHKYLIAFPGNKWRQHGEIRDS